MTITSDEYSFGNTGWTQTVKTDASGNERIVHEHTNGTTFVEHDDGTLEAASLNADQLFPTPAENVPQSVFAALTSGKIVAAHTRSGTKVVNPQDQSSNTAAIEACSNWLLSKSQAAGTIYLPAHTPDGSRFVIESQATVGSTTQASSISVKAPTTQGERGNIYDGTIGTNITDGSAAIHIVSDTDGAPASGIEFSGGFNFGNNNASLVKLTNVNNFYVDPYVLDFAGSGVIMDGVANGCIAGTYMPDNATAIIVDSLSGAQSSDSDVSMLASAETETVYGNLLTDKNGGKIARFKLQGHHEGADAEAFVYLTTNSSITVGSGVHMAASTNGAHGVYHSSGTSGGHVTVEGGSYMGMAGDVFRIESTLGHLRVSPSALFNGFNNTGDAIYVGADPSNPSVVPDAGSIHGTVTYPTGTTNLRAIQTATL